MAPSPTEEPGCFELGIQLRTDPDIVPTEDPTIEWRGSGDVPVATRILPLQGFQTDVQKTERSGP